MAKLSIRLDTRRATKSGSYPLKIAFSREGRTLYIPLNIYIKVSEWDKKMQKVIKRPDRDNLNIHLQSTLAQISMRMLQLQDLGTLRLLSDKDVIRTLAGAKEEVQPHYFDKYFISFISNIKNTRTRDIYTSTQNKLKSLFVGYEELKFEEMTLSWLRTLDSMMIDESLKPNTRSIHFRNIRAVFNAALADELITKYPFRKFKIPSEQTEKRALSLMQLDKLRAVALPEWQEKYRDLFLLGIYLVGINIVDLAKLPYTEGERISYSRTKVTKTKRTLTIRIEPEAQAIINKMHGEQLLIAAFEDAKYRSIANRINLNLKDIGKKAGIGDFTWYACRHTWATIAASLDIPKETISLALGHTSSSVTDIYIKPDFSKVDEANRRVIDEINKER